ncbi:Acyl-CoA oxidase [Teladorsagia circumcincta]|uniref:Acyl-CoA oxidase n=1 Tax=Teladorsagia circumcincta TaxID=45464 RepID=A0A2G9TMM9_TELCI|nr:Acyl-CoA oxidase [Teladorsagia circumcincta]
MFSKLNELGVDPTDPADMAHLTRWPGNLGKSANHAVVVACLIIDGKNFGPHNFIVPLRDPETHMPLKGITVGDIGPKMATGPIDNGFLSFDHCRIPRNNMLMKHARVTPDGKYARPPHAKIGYSAMVHVRAYMISDQGRFLAQALTTAIRYSAVRRQGEIKPGVLSLLAVFHGGVAKGRLGEFERSTIAMPLKEDFEERLKAVVTHLVGQGIEQARMSCGGHGYSKASNIPDLYGVAIGGCTYEGENMVMLQQLARYLMRAAEAAQKGQSLGRLVDYLVEHSDKHSTIDRQAYYDYSAHLKAFDKAAKLQVMKAYERMRALTAQGLSKEDAWNANAVEWNRAARVHTRQYIAHKFHEHVNSVSDGPCREVLQDLLYLHFNYELLDMAYYLLEVTPNSTYICSYDR